MERGADAHGVVCDVAREKCVAALDRRDGVAVGVEALVVGGSGSCASAGRGQGPARCEPPVGVQW